MYLLRDFSARFLSTWLTDIRLPSAVCLTSTRRRVARGSTCLHCCPLQLQPLLILNSVRNEASSRGISTFDRWSISLALSSHPFAFTLCYSCVLMSHNDAWHLSNDAWALLWLQPFKGLMKQCVTCLIWCISCWNRILAQDIMHGQIS